MHIHTLNGLLPALRKVDYDLRPEHLYLSLSLYQGGRGEGGNGLDGREGGREGGWRVGG